MERIYVFDTTLRDGEQAVSYTHLDVYKRQVVLSDQNPDLRYHPILGYDYRRKIQARMG